MKIILKILVVIFIIIPGMLMSLCGGGAIIFGEAFYIGRHGSLHENWTSIGLYIFLYLLLIGAGIIFVKTGRKINDKL